MVKKIKDKQGQGDMFATTFEDLPLFSGVASTVQVVEFDPTTTTTSQSGQQPVIPGLERDWQDTARHILASRRSRSRKGKQVGNSPQSLNQ